MVGNNSRTKNSVFLETLHFRKTINESLYFLEIVRLLPPSNKNVYRNHKMVLNTNTLRQLFLSCYSFCSYSRPIISVIVYVSIGSTVYEIDALLSIQRLGFAAKVGPNV